MAKRRFKVQVEAFDPEVESLEIQVGDEVYTFIADFKLLSWMEAMKDSPTFRGIDPENPTGEQTDAASNFMLEVLRRGLQRRHPGITTETIDSWMDSASSAMAIMGAVQEYLNYILGEMAADDQGEDQKTSGSTSGVTESTTSASRQKKSGGSNRSRTKR